MTDFSQPQLQLHLETTDDEPDQPHPASSRNGAAAGRHHKPPRPSALPRKSLAIKGGGGQRGARRRSSARFLSIGGRTRNNNDDDNNNNDLSHESLGKMYKQAIKMNAENRINANNSWNFQLIENIDKFLTEDPQEMMQGTNSSSSSSSQRRTSVSSTSVAQQQQQQPNLLPTDGGGQQRRVNFTKASCTLDASVKIYSYRVDDVHLTSYRVLENLHRSDGDKSKDTTTDHDGDHVDESDAPTSRQRSHRSRAAVSTIETNVANINLNKLDSAFDIDPLFHKMSKTFDEGGAKGLLLVNLGTSGNGCNIVFDSGLANDEEEKAEEDNNDKVVQQEPCPTTMIDISSLTTKLEGLLSDQPIHSLSLVPQLAGLRAEFSQLEQEGFVDHKDVTIGRKRRFAPDPNEEKEADKSIHLDVLEKSRFSMGRSFVADDDNDDVPMQQEEEDSNNNNDYGADNFGAFDDGDDDDFDAFIAADDNGQRFSSISFGDAAPLESEGAKATTVLLDAIESGRVLGETEYEFFDTQELSHVAANAWAGSAHWKPLAHLHKPKVINNKEPKTPGKKASRSKTNNKERAFVDLTQKPDLADILRKPPKAKSRRAADPLQLASASITKYTKNENLLPPDAGIRPEVLSSLFLRPNAVIKQKTDTESSSHPKTVGFAMDQVESYGADDWGDGGSFGGAADDDGPGFNMSDSFDNNDGEGDNFMVEELEGVRKVDKVAVTYATIAKKVDVKRLKRDLWTELDSHLNRGKAEEQGSNDEDDKEEKEDYPTTPTNMSLSGPLSFQSTVQSMEANKTQVDVTLPFYFICILHLANEKGLRLESTGLEDFEIHSGDGGGSFF